VRSALAADGSLFQGYHPRMREVHERNAAVLARLIAIHGWPGRALAGADGAAAAARIALHAIGLPPFQRDCLALVQAAVTRGDADPIEAARLEDRIAFNERRPQRYGTLFDWDAAGEMSPWTIDDPAEVDRRRAALGMPPLAQQLARVRAEAVRYGEHAPADWGARQREIADWARSVGWIA